MCNEVWERRGDDWTREESFAVSFVPLRGAHGGGRRIGSGEGAIGV